MQEYRHRRAGIGGMLLAQLIEAARAAGHHTILALISDHNEASIRLHAAAGFKIAGELKEVGFKFGRWRDSTIMQLRFDASDDPAP